MSLREMLSDWSLRRANPDELLSEAARRWNARDERGAIRLARRAAEHHDLAKVVLAQWLMDGTPAREVEQEAVRVLHEAAIAGLPEAQQVLSGWYLQGIGVEKNPDEALAWMCKAADAGNLICQLSVVRFLTDGEFREPDLRAALPYARLAAKQGRPEVLEAIGEALGEEE